jgi:hypothetical protein
MGILISDIFLKLGEYSFSNTPDNKSLMAFEPISMAANFKYESMRKISPEMKIF